MCQAAGHGPRLTLHDRSKSQLSSYLICLETTISSPRLIRAWKRRSWIEHCFRTLKHLLATGACQVHSEDAYYGHLVLRLMGCLVLFYTSRVICKGRLTMEEIIFSLKHYWRFADSEALERCARWREPVGQAWDHTGPAPSLVSRVWE
jgi:hypothetical protein